MKQYDIKINGHDYNVTINSVNGATADVTVNGTPYSVDISEKSADGSLSRKVCPPSGPSEGCIERSEAKLPPADIVHGKSIKSPLPGVIIDLKIGNGQTVKRGEKIAVLEAMKMENDILAPFDGTITKVYVSKGDAVLEGAAIADIM